MKVVRHFSSEMEARLAADFLKSNDLTAEVRGTKEYSSHISGKDEGTYQLFVEDEQFGKAMTLLSEIETPSHEQPTPVDASFYFKKAIISALLAMTFLPIVFNIPSLHNLSLYRKAETNSRKRLLTTIIVIVAQLPAVAWIYFFVESFLAN